LFLAAIVLATSKDFFGEHNLKGLIGEKRNGSLLVDTTKKTYLKHLSNVPDKTKFYVLRKKQF
jgi:hypothetical protein